MTFITVGVLGTLVRLGVAVAMLLPGTDVLLTAPQNLSPDKMAENLQAFHKKALGYQAKAQKMYKKAKRKKDVMMILCLEPKVKDLAFWSKELGFTIEEFQSTRKSESAERIKFVYQKGVTISDKVEQLFIEATQCVGDEHFITAGKEGTTLKVEMPDYVVDPEERLPVGDSIDEQNNASLDENPADDFAGGSSMKVSNPDWGADVVWPEATHYM